MNIHFQHINYLAALAIIPVFVLLYFLLLRWKKKTIQKIGDERLVHAITKSYSPKRFTQKFLLICLAFAIGVLALANLRSPQGSEKVSRNGIDVMIALDVSKSMLAQDIKPSRLDRAKQLLGRLIDGLSNDRVGIVVFAGRAYLQMPLTGDHGAAKMFLSAASPDAVPTQGTVIGDALTMCSSAFNGREKKYKAVILISDGEDHDEGALKIASQMANEGVSINTIGIGSPEGATILDETTNELKMDINGNTVVTKLNETSLRDIAAKANGTYQLFTSTDEVLAGLQKQLGSMDQRTVTEDSLINYKNYFQWFLGLMLMLLLTELLLPETRSLGKNKMGMQQAIPVVLVLMGSLMPMFSHAQKDKQLIRQGNEAFGKKEYEKAISKYKEVQSGNQVGPIAQYNLGNALYKNQQFDDAVNAYNNALTNSQSKEEKAKSYYNKGVVLQNNKKIPECISAYKNALKLNPEDEDARQNLQKALIQQQQQQQQQKEKEDDKKKQPKQNQQDKQKQKEEDKQEQQKPQPSKISKQDAEEKLKALLQQEKNLQDKLRKVNAASPNKPEKDW
ncbi:MAG: VWA domain-containing protein [Sphingobacteriales bacterium]|nr:VWA domain-containing protein [Sphingobacteriales bacterium]